MDAWELSELDAARTASGRLYHEFISVPDLSGGLYVLEAGAIRYFDCAALAADVRSLIHNGEWRFATPPAPAMARWALEPPGRPASQRSSGSRPQRKATKRRG